MPDYIRIAVLENEIEAQLVEAILAERAIPHRIQSYRDLAYDGLFQTVLGWGGIYAPADYQEEIMEIIAELRA